MQHQNSLSLANLESDLDLPKLVLEIATTGDNHEKVFITEAAFHDLDLYKLEYFTAKRKLNEIIQVTEQNSLSQLKIAARKLIEKTDKIISHPTFKINDLPKVTATLSRTLELILDPSDQLIERYKSQTQKVFTIKADWCKALGGAMLYVLGAALDLTTRFNPMGLLPNVQKIIKDLKKKGTEKFQLSGVASSFFGSLKNDMSHLGQVKVTKHSQTIQDIIRGAKKHVEIAKNKNKELEKAQRAEKAKKEAIKVKEEEEMRIVLQFLINNIRFFEALFTNVEKSSAWVMKHNDQSKGFFQELNNNLFCVPLVRASFRNALIGNIETKNGSRLVASRGCLKSRNAGPMINFLIQNKEIRQLFENNLDNPAIKQWYKDHPKPGVKHAKEKESKRTLTPH